MTLLAFLMVGFSCKDGGSSGGGTVSSLSTKKDSLSYTLGMDIAKSFSTQGIDVDPGIVGQGMKDYSRPVTERLLDDNAVQVVMNNFQNEMRQKAAADQAAKAQVDNAKGTENAAKGAAFLAENKTKPGVIELEGGLQYKELKAGNPNGKSPQISDEVTIHYTGKLLDGTVFDSSVERGEPATFALSRLIRGWQIAMPLMKEGAKWELYIPADLAYGQNAPPNIGPNQTLIFEIELFGVPTQK